MRGKHLNRSLLEDAGDVSQGSQEGIEHGAFRLCGILIANGLAQVNVFEAWIRFSAAVAGTREQAPDAHTSEQWGKSSEGA